MKSKYPCTQFTPLSLLPRDQRSSVMAWNVPPQGHVPKEVPATCKTASIGYLLLLIGERESTVVEHAGVPPTGRGQLTIDRRSPPLAMLSDYVPDNIGDNGGNSDNHARKAPRLPVHTPTTPSSASILILDEQLSMSLGGTRRRWKVHPTSSRAVILCFGSKTHAH
jgi:hypothetical protein